MEIEDTQIRNIFPAQGFTAASRHAQIPACALPEYPVLPHLTSSKGVPIQGVESCRWPPTVLANSLGIDGNNE